MPSQGCDTPKPARALATLAVLSFCLLHSVAVLETARPAKLLYPPAPLNSGISSVEAAEKALMSRRLIQPRPAYHPLDLYIRMAGIDQQWNTFAPSPPPQFAHYSVVVGNGPAEELVWSDGIDPNRSGVGLWYDPMVKFVDNLGQGWREFDEAFLRFHARRYLESTGALPERIFLKTDYRRLAIDANGAVAKDEPRSLILRSLHSPR